MKRYLLVCFAALLVLLFFSTISLITINTPKQKLTPYYAQQTFELAEGTKANNSQNITNPNNYVDLNSTNSLNYTHEATNIEKKHRKAHATVIYPESQISLESNENIINETAEDKSNQTAVNNTVSALSMSEEKAQTSNLIENQNNGVQILSINHAKGVGKVTVLEDAEDISDWSTEYLDSFYLSNDSAAGSYSMELSSGAKNGAWTGKIKKSLPASINLNDPYPPSYFSIYAKKGNNTHGAFDPRIAVTLRDDKGVLYITGSYGYCGYGGITVSSESWQNYKFKMKLPSGFSNLEYMQIDLYSSGCGWSSPADLLIDQISIEQYSCTEWWPATCPMVMNGIYFAEQTRTCTAPGLDEMMQTKAC